MHHAGDLACVMRPKLVVLETSRVILIPRSPTECSEWQLRDMFARGLLTQFGQLRRLLSISDGLSPMSMVRHSVCDGNRAAARRNRLKIDLCGSRYNFYRNQSIFEENSPRQNVLCKSVHGYYQCWLFAYCSYIPLTTLGTNWYIHISQFF